MVSEASATIFTSLGDQSIINLACGVREENNQMFRGFMNTLHILKYRKLKAATLLLLPKKLMSSKDREHDLKLLINNNLCVAFHTPCDRQVRCIPHPIMEAMP